MTEETELDLRFTFDSDEAAERAVAEIERRLGSLEEVNEIHARVETMRTLEAAAAVVSVTLLVIHHAPGVVRDLRKLVQEIRNFIADFRPRQADADIGTERKEAVKLEAADIERAPRRRRK